MKILWIVNSVLGKLSFTLYGKESNGLWMQALLNDFKGKRDYELIIATTVQTKSTVKTTEENITYYALPDNFPLLYNENKPSNAAAWKKLLADEKPDIIQVWGTEFTHGLCALRQAKNIPSVIYMQGLLSSIARYYCAGISEKELRKTVTLRDFLKRDSILRQRDKYLKSSEKEDEMFRLSGRIITENEWCVANVRARVPDIRTYCCPLSINKTFAGRKWDINRIERHSVTCTASGYTIKGLHMVFKAAALLKEKYPDLKIYVPGTPVVVPKTAVWQLRKNGYSKYIENMIKELKLGDNVVWLGNLTQEELARQYEKTHVFAMSSSIENHSSSLKEAMAVGVPSVSSAVGGIPEYVKQGENGLLYRFEEYPLLAEYISKIFEDDNLAQRLSENARESMEKLHFGASLFDRITGIYNDILNK